MSASPVLHIKDSYYFEVPKFLWRSDYNSWQDLYDHDLGWVIAASSQYKAWELEHAHEILAEMGVASVPAAAELESEFSHWQHAAENHGGTVIGFLESQEWFTELSEAQQSEFRRELSEQVTPEAFAKSPEAEATWNDSVAAAYNSELSGKIIIPQPFGTLKNLNEKASGFCISKYMILMVVVAIIMSVVFIRLSGRIRTGDRPKGRLWNLLEAMLLFFRDEVARPAIGHDADRFVPLLWTIFFFVLGCNLMGMVPWTGAPTSAFAVTLALALCTLVTGIFTGSIKFGPVGFWKNQVPSMDLPLPIAVVLKPGLWIIEVAGMFIKHGVLAIRLLANMMAGHLVLLGILTLAFSLEAVASGYWWVAAPVSVVGSALFSILELFVAFLQAYIFTFLSALFIGAANHHH